MKAMLVLCLLAAACTAMTTENFVHGEMPSAAVTTAEKDDHDQFLWASLVEEDSSTASDELTAADYEEDYKLPASLTAEEGDGETDEDTFALVEAASDEPVVYENAANSEVATDDSVVPSTERTTEEVGDAILNELDHDNEYDHESMHAWEDSDKMADSEAEEIESADLVNQATQNSAAFLEEDTEDEEEEEAEADEADEEEDEADEEEEEETEGELNSLDEVAAVETFASTDADVAALKALETELALGEYDALDHEIDADIEHVFLQIAQVESESQEGDESDDEIESDMSESPALL